MNKIIIITAWLVFFQTMLHAENYSTSENTNASSPDPKIITPGVASQYDLDGMKTRSGKSKSTYSTNTVDKENAADEGKRHENQRNQYGSNNPVIPVAPVILIIDE